MIFFFKHKNLLLGKRAFFDPEYLSELQNIALTNGSDFETISDKFNEVISNLRINGTYKKTARKRLEQTEKYLFDFAESFCEKDLKILDLGGSDGTTSLELAEKLNQIENKNIQIVLADINFSLTRFSYGLLKEYRSEKGEPILMKIGRFGLILSKHRYEFNYKIEGLAKKYLKLNLRKKLKPNGEISLLNPFVFRSNSVVCKTLDCLNFSQDMANSYSAIRASNILYKGYFPPEDISAAVKNLHTYLKNDGLIIISRNHENGEDNGSVWKKESDRFIWQADFGKGSEIKNLVNNFRNQ